LIAIFLSLSLGCDNFKLSVLTKPLRPTLKMIFLSFLRTMQIFPSLVRLERSDAIFAFLYDQLAMSSFLTDSAGVFLCAYSF